MPSNSSGAFGIDRRSFSKGSRPGDRRVPPESRGGVPMQWGNQRQNFDEQASGIAAQGAPS